MNKPLSRKLKGFVGSVLFICNLFSFIQMALSISLMMLFITFLHTWGAIVLQKWTKDLYMKLLNPLIRNWLIKNEIEYEEWEHRKKTSGGMFPGGGGLEWLRKGRKDGEITGEGSWSSAEVSWTLQLHNSSSGGFVLGTSGCLSPWLLSTKASSTYQLKWH